MLALMTDQVYTYYYLKREKLTLNKLEQLSYFDISAIALMIYYIEQNSCI